MLIQQILWCYILLQKERRIGRIWLSEPKISTHCEKCFCDILASATQNSTFYTKRMRPPPSNNVYIFRRLGLKIPVRRWEVSFRTRMIGRCSSWDGQKVHCRNCLTPDLQTLRIKLISWLDSGPWQGTALVVVNFVHRLRNTLISK